MRGKKTPTEWQGKEMKRELWTDGQLETLDRRFAKVWDKIITLWEALEGEMENNRISCPVGKKNVILGSALSSKLAVVNLSSPLTAPPLTGIGYQMMCRGCLYFLY